MNLPAVWAVAGGGVGCGIGWWTPRLLTRQHRFVWLAGVPTIASVTAALFALLAWRVGGGVGLVLDSALAAFCAPLSATDFLEQRLPVVLVWPGYLVAMAIVVAGALSGHEGAATVRAVVSMVVLAASYGLIAVVSRGGLQMGDVRLAGLLGLVLGWTSWRAVVMATVLSFVLGGVAALVLMTFGRPRQTAIPFGPAMLAAACVALVGLTSPPS
jgi:leader peptidase (prepilin peptidase)/N-methyltransferase